MSTYPGIERAERIMDQYLDDLKNIVNIDSGTYNKRGVERIGAYLQQRFSAFGFDTRFERQEQEEGRPLRDVGAGSGRGLLSPPATGASPLHVAAPALSLVATHAGNAPRGPRLLLIGHMDTVFADEEAQRRPFAISSSPIYRGRRNGVSIATGPGVLDMKSGILIGMYALHLLITAREANYRSVTFVCNSDEEIGSPGSKPLIQELARQADAALVLEPGRSEGTIVSSRRGVGQYRVEVQGVSAHAGVEPKHGRNAILELAYQVQRLQALNETIPGTSLNVGVIRGGERTNIVPAYASCDIDIRVSDQAGLQALEAAMRRVISKTLLQGTKVTLSGSMCHMPFERTEGNARLVQLAKEAGLAIGLKIEDVGSGGGSDGNTTSAMGVPTLDGLGAGGGLAHNPGEYIELDYLPARIALLMGLIQRIGEKL